MTVSLSAAPATGETATVSVSTANGTALDGTDYTALSATAVDGPPPGRRPRS